MVLQVKEKMDKGLISLEKFVITKQLTKRPEDYPDKNQPHVQVALRRSKQHERDGVAQVTSSDCVAGSASRRPRTPESRDTFPRARDLMSRRQRLCVRLQGQTVPYIICVELSEDGQSVAEGGKGLAERAYHKDEVKALPRLRVDAAYYLANQVGPRLAGVPVCHRRLRSPFLQKCVCNDHCSPVTSDLLRNAVLCGDTNARSGWCSVAKSSLRSGQPVGSQAQGGVFDNNVLQVHPVVSRLCAPIEGTDNARLADCLGLDPSKFHSQPSSGREDYREEALMAGCASLDDDELYKVKSLTHSVVIIDESLGSLISRGDIDGRRDTGLAW